MKQWLPADNAKFVRMKYPGKSLEIRAECGQGRKPFRKEWRRMPATSTPQVAVFSEVEFDASAMDLACAHPDCLGQADN
jgi:hypothetical protein